MSIIHSTRVKAQDEVNRLRITEKSKATYTYEEANILESKGQLQAKAI